MKLRYYGFIQEYLKNGVFTALKINNADFIIDDELTASLVLADLTDDFEPLVMAVENSKEKWSVDIVKNLLLQDTKFDNQSRKRKLIVHKNSNSKKRFKFSATTVKNMGIFLEVSIKEMVTTRATIESTETTVRKTERMRRERFHQHLQHQTWVWMPLWIKMNNKTLVKWYGDSWARNHMMNNIKNLYKVRYVEGKKVIISDKRIKHWMRRRHLFIYLKWK